MVYRRALSVLAASAALFILAALVLAEPAPTQPSEGVLLLRSGRVLMGKIRREGERYFVTLPLGEIRLRADEVEHACGSVAEGYQYKRSVLPGNAGAHLELAGWCIANGLWDEAQHELDAARRLEPRHPRIPLLERRLSSDRQQTTIPKPAAIGAPQAVPPRSPPEFTEEAAELPTISKDAMEMFTSVVQPILQNHCATAGCHGPSSSSSFRLARPPYGRPANQRISQQNLREVLRCVDKAEPANSSLLMTPIKPHGSAKDAVFKGRDMARYRQLVAWVHHVANKKPAEPSESDHPPLLQPDSAAQQPKENALPKPPAKTKPAAAASEEPTDAESTAKPWLPLPGGLPDSRQLPLDFTPRDPFDPEIFNRRHFPGRGR